MTAVLKQKLKNSLLTAEFHELTEGSLEGSLEGPVEFSC